LTLPCQLVLCPASAKSDCKAKQNVFHCNGCKKEKVGKKPPFCISPRTSNSPYLKITEESDPRSYISCP
jgi:hypothetical protein